MPEAICNEHNESKAVEICPRCGALMCQECLTTGELCLECRTLTNSQKTLSWTHPGERSIFGIIGETWKNLGFHPVRSGRVLGARPKLGRAFLFAFITLLIINVANLLLSTFSLISPALSGNPEAGMMLVETIRMLGITLLFNLMLFLVFYLLIALGQILLGNPINFKLSLVVLLYAQTAALLSLIPFLGTILTPLGIVLLTGMLLKGANLESTGKAWIAILLPTVIMCSALAVTIYIIWHEIEPIITEIMKAAPLLAPPPTS